MQDAMKITHSENYQQGIKFGGLVDMSMSEYTTRLISTSSFAWFRGCSSITSTYWTAPSAEGWQDAAPLFSSHSVVHDRALFNTLVSSCSSLHLGELA